MTTLTLVERMVLAACTAVRMPGFPLPITDVQEASALLGMGAMGDLAIESLIDQKLLSRTPGGKVWISGRGIAVAAMLRVRDGVF